MTLPRRTLLRAALAGAAAVPLASCSSSLTGSLRMVAVGAGGVFERFSRQLVAEVRRQHPDLRLRFEPVDDDSVALDRLQSGQAELAIAQLDMVVERQTGGIRALGRVYENYAQLIVRDDGPVHSLADLRGRTVHLGEETGPSALLGKRILESVPSASEIRTSFGPLATAVTDVSTGKAAGLLWSGEVAPAFIREMTALRLVDLGAALQPLTSYYASFYDPIVVPRGVYGARDVVRTVGCPALLVCPRSLPNQLATAVVEVLLAQSRLLTAATSSSQFVDARSLIATSPIPLHDGVAGTYRDDHG